MKAIRSPQEFVPFKSVVLTKDGRGTRCQPTSRTVHHLSAKHAK